MDKMWKLWLNFVKISKKNLWKFRENLRWNMERQLENFNRFYENLANLSTVKSG